MHDASTYHEYSAGGGSAGSPQKYDKMLPMLLWVGQTEQVTRARTHNGRKKYPHASSFRLFPVVAMAEAGVVMVRRTAVRKATDEEAFGFNVTPPRAGIDQHATGV